MTFDLRAHAREAWEQHEKASRQIDKRTLRDLLRLKLDAPEDAIRFHFDVEAGHWLAAIQDLQFFTVNNQLWLRREALQLDVRILSLPHLHEILQLTKKGEVAA
jgi:hypothetical protein